MSKADHEDVHACPRLAHFFFYKLSLLVMQRFAIACFGLSFEVHPTNLPSSWDQP